MAAGIPWLYQTTALLVMGYLVRFLPEAFSATSSRLTQINPRLEEAARALFHQPADAVRAAFAKRDVGGERNAWLYGYDPVTVPLGEPAA